MSRLYKKLINGCLRLTIELLLICIFLFWYQTLERINQNFVLNMLEFAALFIGCVGLVLQIVYQHQWEKQESHLARYEKLVRKIKVHETIRQEDTYNDED